MKKFLATILSIVLIISIIPMGAFSFTASAETSGTTGECTWSLDGTVLTISGNGTMADYTYSYNLTPPWGSNITEVIIESGVTSIGKSAFCHCSKLEKIYISDSITSINDYAFHDCSNLININIPDGVTTIGYEVFSSCSKLTNITIPDSVKSIGNLAFAGCKNLKNVYISNIATWCGINYNGNNSSNPLSYANNLYVNNKLLTDVVIPQGVTEIPYQAFCGTNITSVSIPDSVTRIGGYAFGSCQKLMDICLPNSVISIEGGAFYNCQNLIVITIPDSVKSIGNAAFEYCYNLTDVYYNGSYRERHENIVISDYDYGNYCLNLANWHYDREDDLVYSYDNINFTAQVIDCNRSVISIQIPSTITKNEITYSVTGIGDYAFSNCSKLKNIIISDNITSIGCEAFSYCLNLENVYITDIAAWCKVFFEDAKSNPLYYAENLFLNRKLITDVIIPDGITRIYPYAFLNCSSVTNIVIPSSVMIIGNEAFNGCSHLRYVYYCGSYEEHKENLFISGSLNTSLTSAYWYYNICKYNEHVYKNDCDSICNNCDYTRKITHDYKRVIDKYATCGETGIEHEECSVCHLKRNEDTFIPATNMHIYENSCDIGCNNCNYTRKAKHTYGNDNVCDICSFANYDISKLFSDAVKDAWYSDAVTYAVGRGILKGYSNGKFGTSDGIQRQDFLVMLVRLDGVDLSSYANTHGIFRDVSRNSYFEAAVNWGYEHGIVTGYNDGRFGVGDKITREQIVTFLCRYARYKGIDTSVDSNTQNYVRNTYTDYNRVSEFSHDAVLWAIEKGVINGKENNTAIAPQGNAQRCEVAQIMYNIFLKDIF